MIEMDDALRRLRAAIERVANECTSMGAVAALCEVGEEIERLVHDDQPKVLTNREVEELRERVDAQAKQLNAANVMLDDMRRQLFQAHRAINELTPLLVRGPVVIDTQPYA